MVGTRIGLRKLSVGYPWLLEVLRDAPEVESRNGKTKELLGATLTLTEPEYCVISRKGFSHDFMNMEILQLLAGVYDKELLAEITPRAAGMITPMTAYGPRVVGQLPLVELELRSDPLSRRAVVYVGKDEDLSWSNSEATAKEMPCTCLWQFIVREEKLHMFVYMRSWDAVWGLSYDVPCFVAVQMALAKALSLPLGEYHHTSGSLHLYERHWTLSPGPNNHGALSVPWLHNSIDKTRENARARLKEYA